MFYKVKLFKTLLDAEARLKYAFNSPVKTVVKILMFTGPADIQEYTHQLLLQQAALHKLICRCIY